jgi:uncharacterized delta-60 repeat protein
VKNLRRILVIVSCWLILAGLVQAATPGNLDRSFSSDGKLTFGFGPGTSASASDVVVQRDGKILIAASHYDSGDGDIVLVRLLPSGRRDRDFSGDGRVVIDFGGANDSPESLALHEGKIIVAGTSDNRVAVARYLRDGRPDLSFGNRGRVAYYLGDFRVGKVTVQPSGKIVVGGYKFRQREDWALLRLDHDGTIDPSFDGDGTVFLDWLDGSGDDRMEPVISDRYGRLIGAGVVETATDRDFAVARWRRNGAPDDNFSGDGRFQWTPSQQYKTARDLAIQSRRYIIAGDVGDDTDSDFMLARVKTGGGLDTTFGSAGVKVVDKGLDEWWEAVAIQPWNDRIVAVGASCLIIDPYTCRFAVGRYRPNGGLDMTFSGDGLAFTALGPSGAESYAWGGALQPNGAIVAAGEISTDTATRVAVARFHGR